MINQDIEVMKGKQVDDAPRVSIIMPAYNVTKYIAEALDSVFAQTYTDYEIIVINDGSPDTPELEAVLEKYRDRLVYIKQKNRGVSGARNTGLRIARSEFIAQLDPDDAWLPNYLAVQMEILQKDPTIDLLYPNAIIFGSKIYAGQKWMDFFPSAGEVTFERLVLQQCNVIYGVTVRRECLLRAGMFDEKLRCSEDFDMWLRVVKSGCRVAYHRQPLFRYRSRPDSLSADPVWMCSHILQVLTKAEQTLELTPNERRSLSESKCRFQAMLRFSKGKVAFFEGDAKAAVENLTEANTFFKSRKIALSIRLLRLAPQSLLRLYNLRDRFFFKADTKISNKEIAAKAKI